MKFITYNKDDPRWVRVKDHPKAVDVPNVFTQVLYNFRDKVDLSKINHAVELGTFEGDTATIFAEHFDKVSTAEQFIDNNSYTHVNLLESYKELKKQYNNIDFYNANSTKFLEDFLSKNPDEQFVFLLDAHTPEYSSVMGEFNAIKNYSNRKDHVIIVDDCVDIGTPGWPSHNDFRQAFLSINPRYIAEDSGIGRKITIIYEPT